MKSFREMSETEMEIMEVLWEAGCPQTLTGLLHFFKTERNKDWKSQTLSTFLTRLAQKGLLTWEQKGRAKQYRPALTKQEYEASKAKGVLDRLYNGSLKNFMAALYDGHSLSNEELDELKKWLEHK